MRRISKKNEAEREEKLSPFECGFNPQEISRSPFSLQFFFIRLLFLIFDLELVLLYPSANVTIFRKKFFTRLLFLGFIFLLFLGLIYEWKIKNIEWIH